jgi:hypothetical protein
VQDLGQQHPGAEAVHADAGQVPEAEETMAKLPNWCKSALPSFS